MRPAACGAPSQWPSPRAWRNPSATRKSPPRSADYASRAFVRQGFLFAAAGDPVGTGLVASLARPGGDRRPALIAILTRLGRVLVNAGISRMSALGANRTRRDGGNDVNDPERKSRVPKCCDAHTVFPATLVASLVRPGGTRSLRSPQLC